MSSNYSVKKLATMAGVSVRTLHHYDRIGLLHPSARTDAGYRLYGAEDLLRLQQILFYRELDIPLQQIGAILDEPGFDIRLALQQHRTALAERKKRITTLLTTIDKTILKLNGSDTMVTDNELYEGFSRVQAAEYRKAAIEKYGEDAVTRSENSIKSMTKEEWRAVQANGNEIYRRLSVMMEKDPAHTDVQVEIANHYRHILMMWGKKEDDANTLRSYRGLAQLYIDDERYTMLDGAPQPAFAAFLSKAMVHFVDAKQG